DRGRVAAAPPAAAAAAAVQDVALPDALPARPGGLAVPLRGRRGAVHRAGPGDARRRRRRLPALVLAQPHLAVQSMTLLSGNSTMPRAPACFSCGTMWRTVLSSRMVSTSTHSGLDSDEIVGCCKAGSTWRTAGRSALRTFIISPTLPSAAIA